MMLLPYMRATYGPRTRPDRDTAEEPNRAVHRSRSRSRSRSL